MTETAGADGKQPVERVHDALDEEDAKLVVLARASRARTGAVEGAAVRDLDGRTYAAATVDLPTMSLTALQAAVASAVSSGVTALEAAAVVTAADGATPDVSVVADLGGAETPVYVAGTNGVVTGVITA